MRQRDFSPTAFSEKINKTRRQNMGRIEKIYIREEPITDGKRTMAQVTDKKILERDDFFFEDRETGQKYKYVLGAFSVGAIGTNSFALILGADLKKTENGKRSVFCIAEGEYPTMEDLVEGLRFLTDEWTDEFKLGWHSDLTTEVHDQLHASPKGIIAAPGYFWSKPNAFQNYLQSLQNYKARLLTEGCPLLRSYMANFQVDIDGVNPNKCPAAIMALAFGVDALAERRPWRIHVNSGRRRRIDFEERE
jgi:hypothetical protein